MRGGVGGVQGLHFGRHGGQREAESLRKSEQSLEDGGKAQKIAMAMPTKTGATQVSGSNRGELRSDLSSRWLCVGRKTAARV